MTDIIWTLSTFVLGCLVGWFTNHWYAVNLKQPKLSQSGSGSGSNFLGTGFHFYHLAVKNELRFLTFKIPETVILGKRLRTRFGSQIIERDTASECRAQLLDESEKHICHLYWLDNNNILDTVGIECDKSANLLLFVRKDESSEKFYVYQPTSSSNLTPKTVKVPHFDKSTNFLVMISYFHGTKKLSFPVSVEIDYSGNFYVKTGGDSSLF